MLIDDRSDHIVWDILPFASTIDVVLERGDVTIVFHHASRAGSCTEDEREWWTKPRRTQTSTMRYKGVYTDLPSARILSARISSACLSTVFFSYEEPDSGEVSRSSCACTFKEEDRCEGWEQDVVRARMSQHEWLAYRVPQTYRGEIVNPWIVSKINERSIMKGI